MSAQVEKRHRVAAWEYHYPGDRPPWFEQWANGDWVHADHVKPQSSRVADATAQAIAHTEGNLAEWEMLGVQIAKVLATVVDELSTTPAARHTRWFVERIEKICSAASGSGDAAGETVAILRKALTAAESARDASFNEVATLLQILKDAKVPPANTVDGMLRELVAERDSLRARLTELEQRLARVAELAHDRDDDTLEQRSQRLGQCASISWDPKEEALSKDQLKRRSTLKWADLAEQLTACEAERDGMRAVVAAAQAWRRADGHAGDGHSLSHTLDCGCMDKLADAVDALAASLAPLSNPESK